MRLEVQCYINGLELTVLAQQSICLEELAPEVLVVPGWNWTTVSLCYIG